MNRTDAKNHIRNGIHRLCRQTSRLNLYVQNTRNWDSVRIATELKQISLQLTRLSTHTQTEGDPISKEE